MPIEPHLRVEAVAQNVVKLLFGGERAGVVEPSFAADCVEQDVHRPLEPGIAEIVQARSCDGLLEQFGFRQSGRRDRTDMPPMTEHPIEHPDEGGALWRIYDLLDQSRPHYSAGWRIVPLPADLGAVPALPLS